MSPSRLFRRRTAGPTPLRIEHAWKERVLCHGPGGSFEFDGAWGVQPIRVYVPAAAIWRDSVPDWLADRRDEVVRLLATAGEEVVETNTGYGPEAVRRRTTPRGG